ncbi:MAG: proteinase inhibitor [Candidatus Binatia bacterium]|nr:proteinase inhibitor [Candidatus Binatia bacterium]MDG2010693.1 proteinase inhibitor [Candidatus Binatia bacterium]
MRRISTITLVTIMFIGCGGSSSTSPNVVGPVDPQPTPSAAPEPEPTTPPLASVGSCDYRNPFSGLFECKHYSGEGWTEDGAQGDCVGGPLGSPGEFHAGIACAVEPSLGSCPVEADESLDFVIEIGGDQGRDCAASAQACTGFMGGTFYASQNCYGYDLPPMSSGGGEATIFQWPTRSCVPAHDGEPEGATDGEVCTWNLISGSTEEGRLYVDYGDCDVIYTNRPYYPLGPWANPPESDSRYDDDEWIEEADWVQAQVRSSACVCCHSEDAPQGPARWSVDAGPLWTDTMSDEAIALFAGITDSSVLGAFPPEQNNGFDRINSAIPSTHPDRMKAFFLGELDRRDVMQEFLDQLPDVGGPLILQRDFVPEACGEEEGIDANGRFIWKGGAARYLWILEEGSENPGLPPNLDIPEGTIWRIDVAWDQEPFEAGVAYGELPGAAFKSFPEGQDPAALTPGSAYYLYVLRDIAIPLARCVFTAP